jgi:hypothetical protein
MRPDNCAPPVAAVSDGSLDSRPHPVATIMSSAPAAASSIGFGKARKTTLLLSHVSMPRFFGRARRPWAEMW